MEKARSKDGTDIAFDRMGDGPPLVVVGGALSDRAATRPLAEEMAKRFTVFNYDRRGRGDSGDTLPYAVEREIEDIEALIAEAGGSAFVYGHSSGAALALHAAGRGCPITKLVMHEPPFTPEDDEERKRESRKDAEEINALLAEGRRSDAVAHILSGIGAPPEVVEGMSRDERVVATAHTLAYDFEVMGDVERGGAVPFDVVERVRVPTLVLCGGESPAWMIKVGKRVADALPDGRHGVLAGQEHSAPPAALAPVLLEFFAREATIEKESP